MANERGFKITKRTLLTVERDIMWVVKYLKTSTKNILFSDFIGFGAFLSNCY